VFGHKNSYDLCQPYGKIYPAKMGFPFSYQPISQV